MSGLAALRMRGNVGAVSFAPAERLGMSIFVGSTYGILVSVTDDTGTPVDPATLTCTVRNDPSVADQVYTYGTDDNLTKVAVGVYLLALNIDFGDSWRIGVATATPQLTGAYSFVATSTVIDDPDL